jgi:hypothetical protein
MTALSRHGRTVILEERFCDGFIVVRRDEEAKVGIVFDRLLW